MKKLLTLTLCLLGTAFAAHAVEIMNADFNTYPAGDINGVNGWVASADGKTNEVIGGELMLATDGDRIMFSGVGTSLAVGERLQITLDYRVAIPSIRSHYQGFGFGIQNDSAATATNQTQLLNAYVFMFGLEPSFRNDGQVNFFPDQQQWTGPGTYVMEATADCGMNPFGYYTNEAPYDAAINIDAESDVLRSVYTVTRTHVTNQFNISVTTTNVDSGGMLFSGSDSGIERPELWDSSDLSLTIHSGSEITNYIQNVKMEILDPVIATPTGVSALGLDGSVSLSWDIMPGATYDIYKSTTSGSYGAALVTGHTSESYSDAAVANGTTYFYKIVAQYSSGTSGDSAEISATPKTIYSDTAVFSTDFESDSLGDLANATDWEAISGSGSNAFAVIDDGGDQKADTAAVESDFDTTLGNAVYVDRLISNEEDDQIDGYIDVVISSSATGGADSDHANWSVLNFGLSGSTSEALGVTKSMMALFKVLVRYENNINVMFGVSGNDSDANRLAYLSWSELGWNPKKAGAAAQSWIGDKDAPLDLETDPIRITWSIRKTRDAGVYQAWASMSNLTSGAVSDGTPTEIAFATKSSTDLYNSPASLFVMGHDPESNDGAAASVLHATVENVSVTHASGVEPDVIAPTLTSVISGDRSVTITWDPVLEALSYTLTVETPGPEYYDVAIGTTATSITDSPRWNDIANTYTLTANFDGDLAPNTASTNFSASPVALEPVYETSSFGTLNLTSTIPKTSNSVQWATMDAMTTPFFENGVDGYTGPSIYGTFKVPVSVAQAPPVLDVKVTTGGDRIHFGAGKSWSQNPFASKLAFVKVSDISTNTTFNAVDSALYVRADWGNWSLGNAGAINGVRVAVRNGTTWYASDYNEPTNPGGVYHSLLVPDVANSDWVELTVPDVNTGAEISLGATVSGSTFTDVNAIGWYSKGFWSCTVYELEVQVSGSLGSYEYWSLSQGLVSTNNAASDDPDMDTIVNELEYAYGGDPLVADTAILPVMDMAVVADPDTTEDSITYVYYKQRDPVSGITYTLKTTDNLVFGPWSDTGYTAVETDIDYYWTVVTNYIPNAADQTFIKVDLD